MTTERAGLRERIEARDPDEPVLWWVDAQGREWVSRDAALAATPDEPVAGLDVERLRDWVMAHAGWAEGGASMMAFDRQLEAALATPDEPVAVDVERLARAHEDIVTMYATHQAGWDVVHDWHSDPGDLFKTRGALKAIVDRADEYDAARLREDVLGDEG